MLPVKYARMFNLHPLDYFIDKDALRRRFFLLSKASHPDNPPYCKYSFKEVNYAYRQLEDDYKRARLMSPTGGLVCPTGGLVSPTDGLVSPTGASTVLVSEEFLNEMIELDEEIRPETKEKMREYLEGKIEECRRKYNKGEYLSRWAYYRRLLKKASD